MLSIQRPRSIPWSEREPQAFFRGRDSNRARLELVKQHRSKSDLFNVGIVAWFFFKHEEEVYGPVANRVGFDDFFKVCMCVCVHVCMVEWVVYISGANLAKGMPAT